MVRTHAWRHGDSEQIGGLCLRDKCKVGRTSRSAFLVRPYDAGMPGLARPSAPSAREPGEDRTPEPRTEPFLTFFSASQRLGGEFPVSSASPRLRVKWAAVPHA
jgi:hypothetical protein